MLALCPFLPDLYFRITCAGIYEAGCVHAVAAGARSQQPRWRRRRLQRRAAAAAATVRSAACSAARVRWPRPPPSSSCAAQTQLQHFRIVSYGSVLRLFLAVPFLALSCSFLWALLQSRQASCQVVSSLHSLAHSALRPLCVHFATALRAPRLRYEPDLHLRRIRFLSATLRPCVCSVSALTNVCASTSASTSARPASALRPLLCPSIFSSIYPGSPLCIPSMSALRPLCVRSMSALCTLCVRTIFALHPLYARSASALCPPFQATAAAARAGAGRPRGSAHRQRGHQRGLDPGPAPGLQRRRAWLPLRGSRLRCLL